MFANAVALVALAALVSGASVPAPAVERATTPKTLAAAASPRYFAAAIGAGHLTNASDPEFAYLAQTQFNGLTPENEMKWFVHSLFSSTFSMKLMSFRRESVEPQQNVFNFTAAEIVAKFATDNNFTLRGHTLVWHSQLAPWVSSVTGKALEDAMVNHIVMG
jgi:endo-1,4-beta-xylanase